METSDKMPNDDILKVEVSLSNFFGRTTVTPSEVLAIASATISEDYYKYGFQKGCDRSRHIRGLNNEK